MKMITDLGQLQKRFQQTESWSTDVQAVLDTFRRSLDRIVHDNEAARIKNHTSVEKFGLRCQVLLIMLDNFFCHIIFKKS